MGPVEKQRVVSRFQAAEASVLPAVLSCAAGLLGLVMVAAGPWVLVTSSPSFASEQPAARATALAESKRVFDQRRLRVDGGGQAGAQSGVVVAAVPGPESK